jgi:DNA repair exonuclease SbcCD nuclease subunit
MELKRNDAVDLFWFTDVHLSDRPPGRRSDQYRAQIFAKLRYIAGLTREQNGIGLCGGDVFHIKNPRSPANSFSLLREAIEVFGSFNEGAVWGCVGNHDIQYDRMDTLSHQPLGSLCEAGVYRLINDNELIIRAEGFNTQILTWDYCEPELLMERMSKTKPRGEDVTYRIGLVHASGAPGPTKDFFNTKIIGYDDLIGLDFDLLLWGHDHSRIPTCTVGGIKHINLGSVSRASLSTDEVDREVVAVQIHLEAGRAKVKEHVLEVSPIKQVFRVADKRSDVVRDSKEVQQFFADMEESVEDISSSDPLEIIEVLCKDDRELCSLVKELCEL